MHKFDFVLNLSIANIKMGKSKPVKKIALRLGEEPRDTPETTYSNASHDISDSVENLLDYPRKFKNPNYVTPKKFRTFKQIVSSEKGLVTGVFTGKNKYDKNLHEKRIQLKNSPVFHWQLDTPPSIKPQKKYCDITGLEAPYLDPKTNLRYHSSEIYQVIKHLPVEVPQEYLSVRNAAVILR